jgi:uncharacterized alkaline shock family protein YloU
MRTFNVIMAVFGSLFLAVLGVFTLAAAVYPPLVLTVGDAVSGPLSYALEGMSGRSAALAAGAVLLLVLAYYVFGNIRAIRRERTVVLTTPLGEVLVSLPAIEDFARVLKNKIDGLRDIKGRVIYTRRGLKVSARVTVLAEYSIAEVTQKVQDAIRNYIQQTLGIQQEINPTVVVTKVVSRERSGSNGPARPAGPGVSLR